MHNPNAYNEKELLTKIAESNEDAFRILYNQYRIKIYNYAVQLTHSQYDANEIVQEVFLKCWLKRADLRQVENFSAWVYTIARHFFVDRLRSIAREEKVFERIRQEAISEINNIDHFLEDKDNEQLLLKAMEQLSPQQREVFELSRRQGLGRQEIALQLGLSENTVRVHLTRALASIRDFLSQHTHIPLLALLLWNRY